MRILLIGARGHVGSAAAAALRPRHDLIEVGRSTDPAVDITDEASIAAALDATGTVDAIIVAAGSVPFRPVTELTRDDYLAAFTGKVLSQLDVVRLGIPHLADGGSLTLTSGILARDAIATGSAASMANGALEAYVMAAAPSCPAASASTPSARAFSPRRPGTTMPSPGSPRSATTRSAAPMCERSRVSAPAASSRWADPCRRDPSCVSSTRTVVPHCAGSSRR